MMEGVAWPRPGAVTVAGITVYLAGIAAGLAGCGGGARPAPSTAPRAAVATAAPSTTTTVVTSTTQAPPGPVPVSSLAPVPATAAGLTAALVQTETALHGAATPLAAVPALGATEQRLVATLASHPAWVPGALAALPGALRPAVSGGVTGDQELSAVPGPTPTSLPPWTIVAPRPAAELLADYRAAQAATGVPWTVLAAINLVETRMGRIVVPGSAAAQGPMQFLPATWARYGGGGDVDNPHDATAAAARLLAANGAARDLTSALHHYNTSVHYARGVLAFAAAMDADIRTFYGYYGWRVYAATTAGTFLLPEGYGA